jgi:hypothetical protein
MLDNAAEINKNAALKQTIGGSMLCGENQLLHWTGSNHELRLSRLDSGELIKSLAGHQAGVRGVLELGSGNIVSWLWDDTL